MILFLLSLFLIYGGLHGYGYLKIRNAIPLSGWRQGAAVGVMLLLLTMPIATHLLEPAHESMARFTAYLGYGWMGFLFFFAATALFMDGLGGVWVLGQWLLRTGGRWPWSPGRAFWLPALMGVLACVYGVFEAGHVRVETITVMTEKLPVGRGRLRLVQISDLHLSLMVGEDELRRVVGLIQELDPDVLVSTGDLVDGQGAHFEPLAELLQQLTPPLGKFAVTGNHEWYVGLGQSRDFMARSGFQLLRGESVLLEHWLTLVGVDDPAALRTGDGAAVRMPETVSGATFVLLLKHRPTVDLQKNRQVDLQLSGHIHKGQIFPFNLLVHLVHPVDIGLSPLVDGGLLYVSRGTGTWGPPFRVFSPPEITVIDLVRPEGL